MVIFFLVSTVWAEVKPEIDTTAPHEDSLAMIHGDGGKTRAAESEFPREATGQNRDRGKFQEILPVVDHWLNFQAFLTQVPGISVGISHGNKVLLHKQYGLADIGKKEKLQAHHLFCCASHSKMFTATAILKLHQDKKLNLHDRVNLYLPWFKSSKEPSLDEITIFHLLTHTAGIITDARLPNGYPPYQLAHVKEIVRRGISTSEIKERIKYSNFGYNILGALIEVVSGTSYESYIDQNILKPLHMTHSAMGLTAKNSGLIAKGYSTWYPDRARQKIEKRVFRRLYGIHSAVGGVVTNAEDLLKFWGAYLSGNQILFSDSFKMNMQREQVRIDHNQRGLGYEITDFPAGNRYHQIIGGTFGYHTQSGILPQDNLAVVVLTNTTDAPVSTYSAGIINLLHMVKTRWDDFKLSASDRNRRPDYHKMGGLFECPYGVYYLTQIRDKLVIFDLDSMDPSAGPVILEPHGNNQFISSVPLFFAKENEPISFKPDGSGQMGLYDSLGRKVKRFSFDSVFRF